MTIERAATATGVRRPDDPAMDPAQATGAPGDGSDLDADVRRFVLAITQASARQPATATLEQRRRWAEEARAPWRQGGPAMLETHERRVPTRHGAVRVRIHRPAPGRLPGLVYLHGGGWMLFSIDTHDRLMREYAARAGCCVIGVDYALSPEHRFPVALEQVTDIVSWLVELARDLDIDAERLAIGGDSAGANLSVAASLVRRNAGEKPPLRGMLLNYGAFTTATTAQACRRYGGPAYMLGCEEMADYWRHYLRSDADAAHPLACPLLAELAGLPPAFLAIAECDILAEQSEQMARRLQAGGVPAQAVTYAGASHSFLEAMSISAVSRQALADAADWLRQAMA